jgi:hypothetical protein
MVNPKRSLKERALPVADQSIKRGDPISNNNSTIERLNFPSEKSWKSVNFDLDAAIYFSDNLKIWDTEFNISQSDYFLIVPMLRLIRHALNFEFNRYFSVSIKSISNLILCDTSQASLKRVKKILQILSTYSFDAGETVLEYVSRTGYCPVIKVHQSTLFSYLSQNANDYIRISRQLMTSMFCKLVSRPKAFCVLLERTYLLNKSFLIGAGEPSLYHINKSDRRIMQLFSTKGKHSLNEIKNQGNIYLKKVLGGNFEEKFFAAVKTSVVSNDIEKYAEKGGLYGFPANQMNFMARGAC